MRNKTLILMGIMTVVLLAGLIFTKSSWFVHQKQFSTHAPDYSWVIGELEYNPTEGGFWQIRFGKENDSYHGKFVLGNHPKLSRFRHGDVVKITGKISEDQVSIFQAGTLYNLESIDLYR